MNDSYDPNQGGAGQPAGGQPQSGGFGGGFGAGAGQQQGGVQPVQPAQAQPMTSAAAAAGSGASAQAAATGNYTFGQIWDGFNTNIQLPPHQLQFDGTRFLRLLAGSISLTKEEKWKIIQYVPKLTQYKVEQLMKILEEEQRKFQELSAEHGEHLQKLEEKHASEWKDLEYKFDQKNQRDEDSGKADDIRKSLGL